MVTKRRIFVGAALLFGLVTGALTSPLIAQVIEIEQKALTDDRSDWTVFVGNNDSFDNAVWIVRYNRVTGETWYKDGKKYVVMAKPKGM